MNVPAPAHYQAPRPFDLEEAMVTPSGQRVTGSRARVLSLLLETARRRHAHRVGHYEAPAGWVPRFLLVEPWSGGQSGDRRLRELRDRYGCEIEVQYFTRPDDGGRTNTSLYRLVVDAAGQPTGSTSAGTPTRATGPRRLDPPPTSAGTSKGSAAPTPTHPSAPPLRNLRFTFAASRESATLGTPLDLAPRRGQFLSMAVPADCGDEPTYRLHLLEAWRDGRLVGQLQQHRAVIFYLSAPVPFDPEPMLAKALTALGAQPAQKTENSIFEPVSTGAQG